MQLGGFFSSLKSFLNPLNQIKALTKTLNPKNLLVLLNPKNLTHPQKLLTAWINTSLPHVGATVQQIKTLKGYGASALGDDLFSVDAAANAPGPTPTFTDALTKIANIAGQVYLTKNQIDAQKQILNVQLQRAQLGLAPLDIDVTKYGLPAPQVNVGLSSDTTKTLLIVAGIAGGLYFLTNRRRSH